MKNIEFELNDFETGFLLGIHLMSAVEQDIETEEMTEINVLQFGLILFIISIYF